MSENKVGLYIDEHVRGDVVKGLRRLGYYVVRAVDVGMEGKDDDAEHLPYATTNRLVLVTFDHPFATRTMKRTDYFCLICLARDIRDDIGHTITLLADFIELFDEERDAGQVHWLR